METIRVLHILSGMNLGGAEAMIMNYYRNIDRNKVQFDFLLTIEERGVYCDEIEKLGGKIYNIHPAGIKTMLLYLRDLNSFFKQHAEYKIVHSHTSSKSVFPLWIAKINEIPVRVCHSHNSQSEGGLKGRIRDFLKMPLKLVATDYLACGEKAAEWLYGKKYLNEGKIKIIYNAIDTKKYLFNKEKRELVRQKLNIENKFVVGNIGRFNFQKNHDFLIDIFSKIHYKYPDSVLMLIGDGELHKDIERKIDMLKLSDNVILTGLRTDVPDLLQSMDVLLFPSIFEGLPVSVVEAQASGLPCIISDCITKEIEFTDLIFYISLKKNDNAWADRALKILNSENLDNRQNTYELIKRAKYDICESAKMLENFYIERAMENESSH